jgi:Fe-S-cluster containining protein
MSNDKIITELPLIRRYSRHNESQDIRFRAFLKFSNVSNAKLDTVVQETTDQVWKQVDCTKCANCCKTLDVVVDDADVKRLAEELKVSVKSFEHKYVAMRVGREKFLKGQPCVFLGDDNACRVYEHRPQACRDFPYLHAKDFRSRSLTMLANVDLCPIVFNVWQILKQRFWTESVSRGRHHRQ